MQTIISPPTTLEVTECCVCGTHFGVSAIIMAERRRTAGTIHCPNGHSIGWSKSESDRLKEQLAATQRELTASKCSILTERTRAEAAERKCRRITKRIHAGVCPCCNRTFTNLARHMATKHPEQVPSTQIAS